MLILRIALVLAVFALVTFLFRKAGGSLKFTKLNMVSAIYYYVLVFNLIGGSLIYIGFRDHYLIKKIILTETIDYTYYALAYTLVMFPLVLLGMRRLVGLFVPKRDIGTYVESGTYYSEEMVPLQGVTFLLIAVCTLATVYVFLNLGYIPLLSMFGGGNLDALRQSGSRNFAGNQYVKNLLMSTLTPFVSYMTYVYYRTTKNMLWRIMFFYMAILSVIVLTYDFAKSPIITYLLGLYLLEVSMGNVLDLKRFKKLGAAAVILVLFFYLVVSKVSLSSVFSIYTGPVGRIIFTQIATLFLHIEAFPFREGFLNGASFNSWMSFLFPAAAGLRSGREVMYLFNAAGVENNTAGVMNTIFIGEAYANFGVVGIIIAPIIFGIVIGFFAYLLPSLKKSPVTILLYVELTMLFITMVEGGFVDIFYSASVIFIILLCFGLRLIAARQQAYRESAIAARDRSGIFFWRR